jgi:hypothetical protein
MTVGLRSFELHVQISGGLTPPMVGVGIYYKTLLNYSLPSRVDMQVFKPAHGKGSCLTLI